MQTFKYHHTASPQPSTLREHTPPNSITTEITAPALYYSPTRMIETFTETVTEVWVGNRLSKILVTDTTRRVETKQEFISSHSIHEPRTRELTASVTQFRREYWL